MMEVNKLMNEKRMKAKRNTEDALKTIFAMESLVFTQDGNFTRLMKDIEKEDQEKNPMAKNGRLTFSLFSDMPYAKKRRGYIAVFPLT